MLFGTIVSGLGFFGSAAERNALGTTGRTRALLSAFYVEGYLAFTLPTMLAGFLAPVVGLTTAADFCGAAVVFLALASLSATIVRSGMCPFPLLDKRLGLCTLMNKALSLQPVLYYVVLRDPRQYDNQYRSARRGMEE